MIVKRVIVCIDYRLATRRSTREGGELGVWVLLYPVYNTLSVTPIVPTPEC